jgi:hypothetical protein
MTFYDRLVVPVVRSAERLIRRPPFGQSVIAVARVVTSYPDDREAPEGW